MMRVRLWRWSLVGAIGIALAIGLAWPERARAHAVLERSLPVQNQELAQAPELVETWYSEPLERSFTTLRVLDTQGNPGEAGETLFSDDPRYAAVALPADLGPGIYTVTYQNVSTVDGHAWSGSFSFVVLNPDGSVPQGTAFQPKGQVGTRQGFLPGVGDSTLRWFGLLAAVVLVGATAFYLFVARPSAEFMDPDEARPVEANRSRPGMRPS
jgi:copper transport protein